ncbi:MAG: FxsA family protein [bacterium]
MLKYLIILFTVIPALELTLIIIIGQKIGVFSTLAVIILTGITGAYLAKIQGLLTLYRIQNDIQSGIMPADRLVDGFIILCCGLMLLTPGFLTDIFGFLGLIPFTRNIFKNRIKHILNQKFTKGRVVTITPIDPSGK